MRKHSVKGNWICTRNKANYNFNNNAGLAGRQQKATHRMLSNSLSFHIFLWSWKACKLPVILRHREDKIISLVKKKCILFWVLHSFSTCRFAMSCIVVHSLGGRTVVFSHFTLDWQLKESCVCSSTCFFFFFFSWPQ